MPAGLVRYQQSGQFHFVTFSCYARRQHLGSATARETFERSLETMRKRYCFIVAGYVVMPEHIHMLVSEPKNILLSRTIQALKLSVAVQRRERPFWQPRYYDFNLWSERKRKEKLRYMHRNPVKRGLVLQPSDWRWSSFNHWATGEIGIVEIETQWTATRRERGIMETQVSKARPGAPAFVQNLRPGPPAYFDAVCSPPSVCHCGSLIMFILKAFVYSTTIALIMFLAYWEDRLKRRLTDSALQPPQGVSDLGVLGALSERVQRERIMGSLPKEKLRPYRTVMVLKLLCFACLVLEVIILQRPS